MRIKYVGTLIALLSLLLAQEVRGADEVEFYYGYYKDDNRLTVTTPSVSISKDLLESTNIRLKYTYETFEKEAPPEDILDAVTGATTVSGGTGGGFEEVRQETIVGLSHQTDGTTLGGSYFYGDEDDFQSNAFSFAVSQELFQKNLTLTAVAGISFDEVDNLDKKSFESFPKDKDIYTLTVAAAQIINPKTAVTGGYSYSRIEGFQSLPLRKIRIESSPTPGVVVSNIFAESHPDTRDRNTVFFRLKRYFLSRTAADINLSYYFDSWGVRAFGNELRLLQYLKDHLIVRFRYRFYSQSNADFFATRYTTKQSLMSADTRLRDFDTHTIGLKWIYGLNHTGVRALRDWFVSLGYDRYIETNGGLKAHILQSSLKIPF